MKRYYIGVFLLLGLLTLTACDDYKSTPAPPIESTFGYWEQSRAISDDGEQIPISISDLKNAGEDVPFIQMHIDASEIHLVVFERGSLDEVKHGYTYSNGIFVNKTSGGGGFTVVSVINNEMTIKPADQTAFPIVFRKIEQPVFTANIATLLGKPIDPELPLIATQIPAPAPARKITVTNNADGNPNFGAHYTMIGTVEILPFIAFTVSYQGEDLGAGLPFNSFYWAIYDRDLKTPISNWQNLDANPNEFVTGQQAEILHLNDLKEVGDVVSKGFSNLVIAFSVNHDIAESKITHYIDLRDLCEQSPEAFSSLEGKTGCH